ncbi:hypothetical protein [Synoicihabitans lomoniglobus]|uniref:Uncharacterized protein n=1 Tax=Synoicihabitans lomoniglobus TaxID=2909285 RepID=A0AAF0CSS6_9BACT|nr:hypothetical protein [Opitutaceae bacterium LMO-M01]WED67311.1 hypothetical protein PXH66_10665 [Opitutaceae bacterium LMO-M01]
MESASCHYCGLPFKVRTVKPAESVYCCAGCALAERVRTEDGNFPVTPELIVGLLASLAVFNQVLFAVLAWLMQDEGKADLVRRFEWGSLSLGAAAFVLLVVAQRSSGARTPLDLILLCQSVFLLILGVGLTSPFCAAIGTIGLLGWSARGLVRRRAPQLGPGGKTD